MTSRGIKRVVFYHTGVLFLGDAFFICGLIRSATKSCRKFCIRFQMFTIVKHGGGQSSMS